MDINVDLVKELIAHQFPEFSDLEIKMVEKSGHDNRTFHLGDNMSVRLPSGPSYALQIEKELTCLPIFKNHISLTIPSPIAKGEPSSKYPFNWAINRWIEGETVNYDNVCDLKELAVDLARFLKELQSIDASLGPLAGEHNFYRGGSLEVYDCETRNSLKKLKDVFDIDIIENIWNTALKSKYEDKPVWVHGDVAVGNLLVKNGKLSSVIDFGILGTGDPACDYVMAWTFFDSESRQVFKEELNCDEETLNRAKGWALWKALITYDINDEDSKSSQWAKYCIDELLKDIV